ncbi:probable cyclin-dependent serine/threonine-protein kinase DDB_G0292550, partial [Microplitis mediator]|uniref:probable cyclin-dependent serine/threonine-protein kinase DDB_G0292550 n=1 Tax=Microplitis mediator TaxID=375433 RepID=UPI0025525226
LQTAGHAKDQQNVNSSASLDAESSVEAAPSGPNAPAQGQVPADQVARYRAGHDCEGSRCVCQRYENGELAVVAMGRMNRNANNNNNNQEQRDDYQNLRIYQYPNNRVYQNRPPNLNPHYQNPVDLVRIHERNHGSQENIYERLDNDEDDDNNNDNNEADPNEREAVVVRNEPNDQNERDHMYERIDNRPWHRGGGCGNNHHHRAPNNFPASSVFWNAIERNANRYDPRDIYSSNNAYLNRLSLSRNCFSTDNVAMASNGGRYVYHLGHNCMCQFCMRLPFIRYHMCQQCSSSFHDRLRCYDESGNPAGASGTSRNYIYQVSRSCRCAYCRGGDYSYSRFPISAASRLVDSLRRDCHHCGRNPAQCNCRNRLLTTAAATSNSAIYIGRIDRIGFVQTVNNPLYANPMIYVGRIDRSLANQDTGNEDPSTSASAATAAGGASASGSGSGAEGNDRNLNQPGPSNQANDNGDNAANRQHTCDDSCIRNNSNNASGICQFTNRNERSNTECNSGRVSYHWWFVNRWLPPWGSQNDRNSDTGSTSNGNSGTSTAGTNAGPSTSAAGSGGTTSASANASTSSASASRAEEPRDPQGSDSDEP